MYRSCLYCKLDLGTNDVLETLPVGRRVAFDPARGRLWVVCPRCHRWNLTPLEDRWEAVEDCERLHRATRLRMGTDQVSLAHLPSGLELVRVGKPLRPELAAWRFAARLPGSLGRVGAWLRRELTRPVFGESRVIHHVPGAPLALRLVRQHDVRRVLWRPADANADWSLERQLVAVEPDLPNGAMSLRVEIPAGQHFAGPDGLRLGGLALTELNRGMASPALVRRALEWLDQFGNPFDGADLATEERVVLAPGQASRSQSPELRFPGLLAELDPAVRLALEMASHEAEERLFLRGELWRLERAWQEAEEIAAIADRLGLPEWAEVGWMDRRMTRGADGPRS